MNFIYPNAIYRVMSYNMYKEDGENIECYNVELANYYLKSK